MDNNTLMIKVHKALKKSRSLISKEESWTKKHYAQDLNGKRVRENSEHAVCWCSVGALSLKVTEIVKSSTHADKVFDGCLNLLVNGGNHSDLSAYNDDPVTTHGDILSLFDKAIEKSSAR